jgi:hypothetical protein
MTQILLLPLMVYAAGGLALSLVVHILSFFGIALSGNTLFIGLHVGIFPLWLPVVLIAQEDGDRHEEQGFLEGRSFGVSTLDAVHDLWLLHLRLRQLRDFHIAGVGASATQGGCSFRGRVARLFGSLDGVLLDGARDRDHRLSPGTLQPAAPLSNRTYSRLDRQVLSDMRRVGGSPARPRPTPDLTCHT